MDLHRSRGLTRRTAAFLLPLLALGALLGAARVAGVTWWVVESPSMGTAAPVGALVIDERATVGALRVGDVVTYRPPDAAATITHRVVALHGDVVRTRGDINTAVDPWRIGGDRLVGRAVTIVPAAGWVLRLAPLLVAGLVAVGVITLLLPRGLARSAARLAGSSAVAALITAQLRPLTAVQTLAAISDAGGTTVRVVSTGVLPVRISAGGVAPLDLVSGAAGTIRIPAGAAHTAVTAAPLLSPAGWALLVTVCLVPTAISAASALIRTRPAPLLRGPA